MSDKDRDYYFDYISRIVGSLVRELGGDRHDPQIAVILSDLSIVVDEALRATETHH